MDDYEPFRARSNTWPLPRPDLEDEFGANPSSEENETSDILGGSNENASIVIPTTAHDIISGQQLQQHSSQSSSSPTSSVNGSHLKKNTSRRNAWGNMSYADLITQAIQGSPEKRLTLSQIYEWMVQNVPYFKDKGDSNSSAGWKVSSIANHTSSDLTTTQQKQTLAIFLACNLCCCRSLLLRNASETNVGEDHHDARQTRKKRKGYS